MALGVSSGAEYIALLIALCFHQFFEGIALGTTIIEAKYNSTVKSVLMAMIYGVTTPLGIAIGIAIRSSYNGNSSGALLVNGIFDSISAGILIYTAIVEFLTPEITNSGTFREWNLGKKIVGFIAVYAGAAAMAIIGKYA